MTTDLTRWVGFLICRKLREFRDKRERDTLGTFRVLKTEELPS
jgi:hypothetical protein